MESANIGPWQNLLDFLSKDRITILSFIVAMSWLPFYISCAVFPVLSAIMDSNHTLMTFVLVLPLVVIVTFVIYGWGLLVGAYYLFILFLLLGIVCTSAAVIHYKNGKVGPVSPILAAWATAGTLPMVFLPSMWMRILG